MSAFVEALTAQGGILADSVRPPGNGQMPRGDLAHLAARGPRAIGQEGEYELLLELIIEGSRLHYGSPRVVQTDDPDLALLLGDQLYALGLARLAALGDLEAVSELADVISLVAEAQAAEDPVLAEAIWRAGASAIGWGAGEGHAMAKGLARSHDAGAVEALRQVTVAQLRDVSAA